MGGTTSKPQIEAPAFAPDYSKAQFSADYVQSALDQATKIAQKSAEDASTQLGELGSEVSWLTTGVWSLGTLLFLASVGFIIYYVLFKTGVVSSFFGITEGGGGGRSFLLHSAMQDGKDVSGPIAKLIVGETLNISPSISSTLSGVNGPVSGTALPNPIILNYQFSDDTVTYTYSITDDSQSVSISSANNPGKASGQSTAPPSQKATSPSWFSSLFAGSGGSGTLVSSMLDATNSSVVKATSAPLSSGGTGAYGMQWWMFIKDWNYGYGKDKQVLARADPTNTQVLNPSVALHPTDNTMRITVSVFPDESGSSSKTQPAPAGHTSSTDDVFVCEVPNLPLQDWFSVSMTVFGRNLDVYIDGKLVKSCLLSGVPKPASGDITMAGNGGFSGSLCNFNHYSRMLVPADAASFYSAGTSCKSSTGPSTASAATGYAVKFGVYDTVGKKIQEYTF
jgi:hypothetical protein